MPIAIYCQQCGKQYHVTDKQAGMLVRCPNGHHITVPQQDPNPASVPAQIEVVEDAPLARDFSDPNPYASPLFDAATPMGPRTYPTGKVRAPAMVLLVLSSLGIIFSFFGILMASFGQPPVINPNAPEILRRFQEGQVGVLPAVIQCAFVGVNAFIIVGAIQMIRFKSWALALASSILAMVNFGNCCCLLGVPVGIWALVILLQEDVKAAFLHSSR